MSLPYGLRDVKVTGYTGTGGALGTPVDFPNARTFSWEESEDFEELRGDDKVVANRGSGATASWELEGGGISLEAMVVINGGTLVSSGTGATTKKTYTKKSTDSKPRFKIEGQSLAEDGGDFHIVLPNCKATDGVSGELADQAFWLTSASGTAIGNPGSDTVYEFVENATITAISAT